MIVNILYCLDFPRKSENIDKVDQLKGWFICSHRIIKIDVPELYKSNYFMDYGSPRPDVAQCFRDFPGNETCGFIITALKEPIDLKEKFLLELEVEASAGVSKKIAIKLDLESNNIQDIEYDDDHKTKEEVTNKTEKKFFSTLEKHPWITIRMDITNKCNLRCIMCHYKEKEIYSQPAKIMTAERLKYILQDIAPSVSHIMLSCGFEPLISKHFSDIISMIDENYPHMEIGLCTNAMLMDSKVRKVLVEKNVTHLILSFDGVTRQTIEKIRVGADYDKIVGNIKALNNLKRKFNRNFPVMFMDFVLMNSNIHEAPPFVRFCSELGIDTIDFRHMVGNIFFSDHEDMLLHHKEKYNYYRERIIAEGKKYNIKLRLPEGFETQAVYIPEADIEAGLSDFYSVEGDEQTEEIVGQKEKVRNIGTESDFPFIAQASCLRPFNEIMIIDQEKILPCSWYSGYMGTIDEENTLYSIFHNEKFSKLRQKKLHSTFDHNCLNCPIRQNLLPTEVVK
jgi:MoaA/NifB/PqqE/SkfB family radical SAM enzyme